MLKRRSTIARCVFAGLLLAPRSAYAAPQQDSNNDRPPLVYSINQGGPGFSGHERLTLKSDGSVLYETNGAVDLSSITPSRAGVFATRVDTTTYEKLAEAVKRAIPNGPHRTTFVPDSGIEAIHFETTGGASMVRQTGERSDIFAALVKEFVRLKAAASPHPVRGLEMSCTRQEDMIGCNIRSIGPSPITVRQLNSGRFFCFDRERHLLRLGAPAGLPDARQAQIELSSDNVVALRFPRSACDVRIVLDSLEAILVSNPLVP